jgi:phosphatidylinositol alpha-mannosyltransferase
VNLKTAFIGHNMQKNGRKTIIFSSYDDIHNPYYAGGGARAIYEIAKRLPASYTIKIITGNYPGAKNYSSKNISYQRLGPAFVGPQLGQLLFHLLLPLSVKKESFDLWIESFTPPFSVSSLPKYTKKPVIGLAHMLSAEDMQRKYKLPFHLIEQRGLRNYSHFITITEETRKKIQIHNKRAKFSIIPNGVEAVKIKSGVKPKQKYILFLGRIEVNQKGLDLLIEAYAKIADKTEAQLIIAGAGTDNEEKKLQKLITEKGLKNRILMKGRVDGKKKSELLHNAILVVLPSRFETFGNVVLEAMAYGKPLIGFAINGLHWVSTKCMIKVQPFDTEALAIGLLKVLTDKKTQTTMSKAVRESVKQYSWDKAALAYKQTIHDLL